MSQAGYVSPVFRPAGGGLAGDAAARAKRLHRIRYNGYPARHDLI